MKKRRTTSFSSMILYIESNSPAFKTISIDAINESLKLLPTYGIPHAVRLLIHAVDFDRMKDEKSRIAEKAEAIKLAVQINSGTGKYPLFETYDYLNKTFNKSYASTPYANILLVMIPDEMKTTKEKYESYIPKSETTGKEGT